MGRLIFTFLENEECKSFVRKALAKHFEITEIKSKEEINQKLQNQIVITNYINWKKDLRHIKGLQGIIFDKNLKFKTILYAKKDPKVLDCTVLPLDTEYFLACVYGHYKRAKPELNIHFSEKFEKELTFKEYKIYNLLRERNGFIKKDEIIDLLWEKVSVGPKTVDVHIFNLRKKLNKYNFNLEFSKGGWKLSKRQL